MLTELRHRRAGGNSSILGFPSRRTAKMKCFTISKFEPHLFLRREQDFNGYQFRDGAAPMGAAAAPL
jgi:hypothetical protein